MGTVKALYFHYRHTKRELILALFCSKLYPSLCELAHVLSVDGPVRQRLDALAGELAKAADKELQVDLKALFLKVIADR